ncbi:MAG: AAA family ATPase [Deltaproteobacteria bacterium HGW-Deltaproteobacteria-14]|jgi:ATP-dependent 26S proteasome regulatory subunit|nr:MAG: AAA family ATPase [Deltaproteobacteria bacterium HGW-Deltaproteobacteria-14]
MSAPADAAPPPTPPAPSADDKEGGSAALPAWFPGWAARLAELYFSGTTSAFVIHGNTWDLVPLGPRGAPGVPPRFGTLEEFLAEQLFGRWDLVLAYDLARGLRCVAGSNEQRLRAMVATCTRRVADLEGVPKDPSVVLALLDRFLLKNVTARQQDRLSVAIVITHAAFVAPRGDRLGEKEQRHLVTLLDWAASPYLKRLNVAFVMVDQEVARVSERLTQNPHVATLEVPLPDEDARRSYLDALAEGHDVAAFSDFGLDELARLTAGISLTDMGVLVRSTIEGRRRLDRARFRELKKRLIERQAQGLLDFVEPRWGLDMVVGHEAAKRRLVDDAELLARGHLDSVPMGYLVTGPVGTGKSFLAQCAAGSLGLPCVTLKNFRSKYVGETEANLERVLGVLRSMGPVVVIIDEADAMLGDRESDGGDSGLSSRIFGTIAAQMGDTRYRGRILWMLLTARPDLLPVDLKRQGRAEVHIPLFYPTAQSELRAMFTVLAKKSGATLDAADVPEVPHAGQLSGADIEGVVGRAWRAALLAGEPRITRERLTGVLADFLPSTEGLERELQRLAAIVECTDAEFLPPAVTAEVARLGGRARLSERIAGIKRTLSAQ